ncbi:hypothetical protein GCM10027613_01820 [Microlunatus endophyticus]
MPESEAVLDIRDLIVRYRTVTGDVTAVDGVNLQVKRGEILGVAGQSGCGKSTMATAVLGLLRPRASSPVVPPPSTGGTLLRSMSWMRTMPDCAGCGGATWPTSPKGR